MNKAEYYILKAQALRKLAESYEQKASQVVAKSPSVKKKNSLEERKKLLIAQIVNKNGIKGRRSNSSIRS